MSQFARPEAVHDISDWSSPQRIIELNEDESNKSDGDDSRFEDQNIVAQLQMIEADNNNLFKTEVEKVKKKKYKIKDEI